MRSSLVPGHARALSFSSFLVLAFLCALPALAQPGEAAPAAKNAPGTLTTLAPLEEGASAPTLAHLGDAKTHAVVRYQEMIAANRKTTLTTNGFVRAFEPVRMSLQENAPHRLEVSNKNGMLSVRTSVKVDNAHRLRLHLSELALPSSARMIVYGDGPGRLVDLSRFHSSRGLYTPAVSGERVTVEIEVHASEVTPAHGLAIDSVVQIFSLSEARGTAPGCFVDGPCASGTFSGYTALRRATAQLNVVRGFSSIQCTGTLINDSDGSYFRPLLLTARHCVQTPTEATTVDALFDYYNNSCNGLPPILDDLPLVSGARLLASSPATDSTLIELAFLPPNRSLLGWTTTAPTNGASHHRLSHPSVSGEVSEPQTYTGYQVDSSIPASQEFPASDYLYSATTSGGTLGGSDGAALINDSSQIVGQHAGGNDPCQNNSYDIDGRFAQTFPAISGYITQNQLYHDGFEFGDLSKWSSVQPAE